MARMGGLFSRSGPALRGNLPMVMVGRGVRPVLALDRHLFREPCDGDFPCDRSRHFWRQFLHVATPNWPLLIAAMLAEASSGPTTPGALDGSFMPTLSFLSSVSVRAFFFARHYFIVLLPALSIFSGVVCSTLLHFSSSWRTGGQSMENARRQPAGLARRGRRNARERAPKVADAGAAVPGILLWLAATMVLAASHSLFGGREKCFSCGHRPELAKKYTP